MKKLLLAICLTLMVSTLNGETVKKENVKWIKLEDYYKIDRKNIEKGVVYQEVKGKNYKCGEIINGKKEGNWIEWHSNGQKRIEENYVNGKKERKSIWWYENGQKYWEVNYVNGKKEGKWIIWYENGKKNGEITYKDDREVEVIYWKENGDKVEILRTTSTGERIIKIVNNNLIDLVSLINGTEKGVVYQEVKGEIYKCGDIKNGGIEGKWIEWYENGNKKEEGKYKDGKKEGKYRWWYENGKKEDERTYKDGEEVG